MKTEFENISRIQELVFELVESEEDPERKANLKADLASSHNWFGSVQSIEEFLNDTDIEKGFNWHLQVAQEYVDANPGDPES